MTIPGLLKEFAEKYKGCNAFGFIEAGEEKLITADVFWAHVQAAANYYGDRFSGKQRIGIVGENSYPYLVQMFGIICSGNVAVPLNHTYSGDGLCSFLEKVQVSAVLCDEEYMEDLAEMREQLPLFSVGSVFAEMMACGAEAQEVHRQADDDVILMLLSSGTSGVSKIVQITNDNLSAFPESVLAEVAASGSGSLHAGKVQPCNTLLILPFYHISGIIPLLEDMMRGNLTYISSAKYLTRDIQNYHIHKLILVPAMMKRILKQCEKAESYRKACANITEALCLGAPMDDDLINGMEALSITPRTYYGMTETTGTVSGGGAYKRGACGKVADFCEVRIEEGEILVRGRNVTKGYLGDDAETAKVLRNGWLNTGDLGEVDAEGYLFIRGRKKNVIILSNGENVCPEELEELLYQCGAVEECRVYGEEDTITAQIYYGAALDEAVEKGIREHVRSKNRTLPPSHKIKDVLFSYNPLEKNSMGKIIRK